MKFDRDARFYMFINMCYVANQKIAIFQNGSHSKPEVAVLSCYFVFQFLLEALNLADM